MAVLDEIDRRRPNRAALIGEGRISVDQPQHRGVAGAERDRQIIGIFPNPKPLRGVDHLEHPRLRRRAHGHQVARLLDAPAHSVRTGVAAIEIDEAFIAQARALPHAKRRIDDDRSRRHAVGERGGVNDRLERGPGLPKRLGRPVVADPTTSKPPCIASTRPVCTSSTSMPPEISGIERRRVAPGATA